MTFRHRNAARKMRRQKPSFAPSDDSSVDSPSSSASIPGPGSTSADNNSPVLTNPSSSSPPNRPTFTSSNRPSAASQSPSPPTTSETTSSTESSSSSTQSSTTSSSSSSSTRPVISPTSTSTVILTAPTRLATSSFTLASITGSTSSTTPSTSASATPSSSGIKVGAIVGGIAGALAGIAVLGILISFILRRIRKRNHRDTIVGEDFRTSEFFGNNNTGRNMNNDDILEPPNMSQRLSNLAPSVASGPGMAGHGAFHTGAMYDTGAGVGGYGPTGHGATAYGAAGPMGASAGALHERPKHTFGRHSDDEVDDIAHGVYSSQPQPQVPYNPEAYGSYAVYDSTAGAAGYQEATREYQGQQYGASTQGRYQSDPFSAHDGYAVAIADPGPSTSSGTITGAHRTVARDPTNLSGNRGPNTRSVVQDDDVYGGI